MSVSKKPRKRYNPDKNAESVLRGRRKMFALLDRAEFGHTYTTMRKTAHAVKRAIMEGIKQ